METGLSNSSQLTCGEGFVRISYCYSTKHIIEALERMEAFLQEL